MLTIKREFTDFKTGKLKMLPSGVFDIGKFCAANGIAFKDYCVTCLTRVTRDVTVRLSNPTASARASKRANETAPPPLRRARMVDIGEGGR